MFSTDHYPVVNVTGSGREPLCLPPKAPAVTLKSMHSARSVCVLLTAHNKWLLPSTTLRDWSMEKEFCSLCGTN